MSRGVDATATATATAQRPPRSRWRPVARTYLLWAACTIAAGCSDGLLLSSAGDPALADGQQGPALADGLRGGATGDAGPVGDTSQLGDSTAARPPSDAAGGPDAAVACGSGPRPAAGQGAWPVPSQTRICQRFRNPIQYQTCGFHTGVDICTAASGSAIVAMAAGKVVHVGPMWYDRPGSGRGPYAIIVQHSPGFYSTYSHDRVALVKVGDCVRRGQKIAEVGSLGYSHGPHLHFEIVEGTFTGNWKVPFSNACSAYRDPTRYAKP